MTSITSKPFPGLENGQCATLYTLKNGGLEVSVTDFGAAIVSILAPDREGRRADVVLGYDGCKGYRTRKYFLGATIGRCANRIAGGRFTLGGKEYRLARNDRGVNHLHGGDAGFDQKLWGAKAVRDADGGQALELRYTSPDGEEGYPGSLSARVVFSLGGDGALTLRYSAESDADTLCNLTNHSYFNLAGHDSGAVTGQLLKLYASRFTEADAESIPTGRILPVNGTPMDFLEFHPIGERIDADYQPLRFGRGYDHNWVLDKAPGALGPCGELYDPSSGRHLACETTLPCVQFYTANFLDGTQAGKGGCRYARRAAACLETQYAPDAVNHPGWAGPILRAGGRYEAVTVYRFGVKSS